MKLYPTGYQDMSGYPIYKNDEDIYFSLDHQDKVIYIGNCMRLDPWGEAKSLEKFKDTDFKIQTYELPLLPINGS